MTNHLPIQLQVILLKEKDCQYFTFYVVAFTPTMFYAVHLLSNKTLNSEDSTSHQYVKANFHNDQTLHIIQTALHV